MYRIVDIMQRSGLAVSTAVGETEEGDPWFIFLRGESDDVIAHFAKIDGEFIAAALTLETPLRGRNLRDIVDQLIRTQPLLIPRPAGGNGDNVFLHPAVVLTAFVATALMMVDQGNAQADAAGERLLGPAEPVGKAVDGSDVGGVDGDGSALRENGRETSDGQNAGRTPGQATAVRQSSPSNDIKIPLLNDLGLTAAQHVSVVTAVVMAVKSLKTEAKAETADAEIPVVDFSEKAEIETVVWSGKEASRLTLPNAAMTPLLTTAGNNATAGVVFTAASGAVTTSITVTETGDHRPTTLLELPEIRIETGGRHFVGAVDEEVLALIADAAALDAAAATIAAITTPARQPDRADQVILIDDDAIAAVDDRIDESAAIDNSAALLALLAAVNVSDQSGKASSGAHLPDGEIPHPDAETPADPVDENVADDPADLEAGGVVGGGQQTEAVADSAAFVERVIAFANSERYQLDDPESLAFLHSFLTQSTELADRVELEDIRSIVLFESETNTADLITFRGNLLMIDHAIFEDVADFSDDFTSSLSLAMNGGHVIDLIGAVSLDSLDQLVA